MLGVIIGHPIAVIKLSVYNMSLYGHTIICGIITTVGWLKTPALLLLSLSTVTVGVNSYSRAVE